MPLFFFHIFHDTQMPDQVGTELADADTARCEAIRTAGRMLSEFDQRFCGGVPWMMRVTDDAGHAICNLTFSATSG